jgi:multidrug resistance efflux pump
MSALRQEQTPPPRRRFSLLPSFLRPSRRAVKRFMARYIFYLEAFGYIAVSLVALAVVSCFFFEVDDVIRLDGDPVAIKPREESIKRKADALVTKVFVRKYQQVKKGDPLVEIVESPEWMSRYLILRQTQALLDEFNAPGQAAELAKKRIEEAQAAAREAALATVKKTGPAVTETEEKKEEEKPPLPVVPLTLEEEMLRSIVRQRLAKWDAQDVAKAPRIVITAPIDGIVISPDDLAFKKIDADAEILKVVDINDLRLSGKFKGETVWDARVGKRATIRAIVPDYKTGVIFRGDTVPRGRWFWQKERVVSYGLLDAGVKDLVKDAFKNKKITQRNDLPFDLTEVTDVEVNTRINTVPVEGGADKALVANPPAELNLVGRVETGKHLLTVQMADIPSSVVQKVQQMVSDKVTGKVFLAPQEPKDDDTNDVPLEPLRVESVKDTQLIAKMKAENPDAKGDTDDLKAQAQRSALRGASLDRYYEATLKIQDPPPFLKERVLELLEQGKEVKARAEVRTGKRKVAFLLLKR